MQFGARWLSGTLLVEPQDLSYSPVCAVKALEMTTIGVFSWRQAQVKSNLSSPSFSTLQAILSPATSHTCLSLGLP